jgi:uncharacterized membrane protein YkoI
MNNRLKIITAAFAAIGVLSTAAFFATPALAQEKGEKEEQATHAKATAPVAKVTPVQAMAAAESKYGGKAKMALFEFDEGHWVYGVVVLKDKKLIEVDVDPVTGKAGDSESVTPDDEAKEFKEQLTAILKG